MLCLSILESSDFENSLHSVRELKLRRIQEKQVATQLMQARDNILHAIPNIVHASVPVVSPVPLLASRLGRERSCGSELSSKSEDHTRNCLLLLRQYYTSAMTNENAGLVDGNGGGESGKPGLNSLK